MRATDGALSYSATDLSNFLACPHQASLERAKALGQIEKPFRLPDPRLDVLRERGVEHERRYLEQCRAEGKEVVEVPRPAPELQGRERWQQHMASTRQALEAGPDVVYQAALTEGAWVGLADFLVRVETPSDLGEWSYEVVDTKLAREAKGGALLQVLLYSDLLSRLQGRVPENVHLALGGPESRFETFRVADYAAYYRSVRDRFLRHVRNEGPLASAVDPVAHCEICGWRRRCEQERRDVDHLSFVAGIQGRQRDALRARDVDTLEALATLELPVQPPLEGVSSAALKRVAKQAHIQAEGRRQGETLHELIEPIEEGVGLAALPAPSDGDLFFDIEGDPFALTHGLDYLFGWTGPDGGYSSLRGLDREAEKAMFERFIDLLMERLERWPDLHVYHFAPYETTALKRLMGLHATREQEVDRLLRGKVFVDLYRVVRQGLRASVESYSIKKLEPLYGYQREEDLADANRALAHFEAWLELGARDEGDDSLLAVIERYNRDDCVSTLRLRDWLEELRAGVGRERGEPLPRPDLSEAEAPETVAEEEEEVARLAALLTADVPADDAERTAEQHGRWLLAQVLAFHRREDKSFWWDHFRMMGLHDEEFIEDDSTLGGLEYVGPAGTVKRSVIHRYRFPPQEHAVGEEKAVKDPATDASPGTIHRVDDARGILEIRYGRNAERERPTALVPSDHVNNHMMRGSLRRLAQAICDEGMATQTRRAAADLLARRPPRCGQPAGAPLMTAGEPAVETARRLVDALDASILAIQGPPGSGKTYTGAHMITRLIADGKRVGVTATSHKVITNLIDEVCGAAAEEGLKFRGLQGAPESSGCSQEHVEVVDNSDIPDKLQEGDYQLVGGTSWLWSREDMAVAVDVLFIDEAGQFSLANALAVSQAAPSLVLLGDPAQLEQPLKGSHPPGSDASALQHLLGEATTMPADRGLFLERTWRLHPDLCAFTSEVYYDSRLDPVQGLDNQRISGSDDFSGTGLRHVSVQHRGNQSESSEEAAAVKSVVETLLSGGRTWTDREGVVHELTLEDILIVAPYNLQVAAIAEELPDGARVGTVDKFQGQEAPIVIYSMASSSPEDAPRGMGFLYNPHRMNVATSRARCLAILVASPALFAPDCRTPEQMRLANGLCRFGELARAVTVM